MVEEIIKDLDKNGNGRIEEKEFDDMITAESKKAYESYNAKYSKLEKEYKNIAGGKGYILKRNLKAYGMSDSKV